MDSRFRGGDDSFVILAEARIHLVIHREASMGLGFDRKGLDVGVGDYFPAVAVDVFEVEATAHMLLVDLAVLG